MKMQMNYSMVVLVCLAVCLMCASTKADSMTLNASADTTIFANNTGNSAGGLTGMFSGTNSNTQNRRALLKFDVAQLPAGATITSVQLTLTLAQVAGGSTGSTSVGLYPLSASWGEGTNQNGLSPNGNGQGAAANPNDATWNARLFGATNWTTPGGDASSTASASQSIDAATAIGTGIVWNSTDTLVADVQNWLEGTTINNGWLLKNSTESTASSFRVFNTKEASSGQPALLVNYTLAPEPASIGLAMSGTVLMLRRRRR